jgi:hypothetical protein
MWAEDGTPTPLPSKERARVSIFIAEEIRSLGRI